MPFFPLLCEDLQGVVRGGGMMLLRDVSLVDFVTIYFVYVGFLCNFGAYHLNNITNHH